jgi:hypothetical protein
MAADLHFRCFFAGNYREAFTRCSWLLEPGRMKGARVNRLSTCPWSRRVAGQVAATGRAGNRARASRRGAGDVGPASRSTTLLFAHQTCGRSTMAVTGHRFRTARDFQTSCRLRGSKRVPTATVTGASPVSGVEITVPRDEVVKPSGTEFARRLV